MSAAFLLTTLLICISPGTGVLYTVGIGLSRGARASLVAAVGCTLGVVPSMAAAILGLAAVLHTSALAFAAIKYAGVAYLLYMAWGTLREHGSLSLQPQTGPTSAARIIGTAVLINILNPKLSIFFLAFLPQFIAADDARPVATMTWLSIVFMGVTLVVFVVYGLFAAALRDRVLSRPQVLAWLRRSFAAAFVALGVKLAFTER